MTEKPKKEVTLAALQGEIKKVLDMTSFTRAEVAALGVDFAKLHGRLDAVAIRIHAIGPEKFQCLKGIVCVCICTPERCNLECGSCGV